MSENTVYTKKIGLCFTYLAITEVIAGLILGIINLFVTGEFGLFTNSTIFLYLVIGFVLIVISFILERAIKIYEENKLTI